MSVYFLMVRTIVLGLLRPPRFGGLICPVCSVQLFPDERSSYDGVAGLALVEQEAAGAGARVTGLALAWGHKSRVRTSWSHPGHGARVAGLALSESRLPVSHLMQAVPSSGLVLCGRFVFSEAAGCGSPRVQRLGASSRHSPRPGCWLHPSTSRPWVARMRLTRN